MLLSCAVRILLSSETCYTLNNMARNLLKQFVSDYPNYYGNVNMLVTMSMVYST